MTPETHPDWPHGMTAEEFLSAEGPWQDGSGCHSCGRRAENALVGHDGMCPVPFLANTLTALATLRARLEEEEKPCIWKTQSDGNGDYWDTACGHALCFEVDGPIENEYEYCPGCGHPLMLVPLIEEIDVDDFQALAPDDSGGADSHEVPGGP